MDFYIGRTVLLAMLVVLLAFFGLMTLFAVLEELREDDVGYTMSDILVYVALTTPRRIYEVLPYVVFLGGLIGLGSLASSSEIVVFRVAGVSAARIYLGVAWPATLLFLFGDDLQQYRPGDVLAAFLVDDDEIDLFDDQCPNIGEGDVMAFNRVIKASVRILFDYSGRGHRISHFG